MFEKGISTALFTLCFHLRLCLLDIVLGILGQKIHDKFVSKLWLVFVDSTILILKFVLVVFMFYLCTGYIKNFQVHDPHRVGRITVDLQGRVNDCKALTYRQDVKAKEIGHYTERTLPTRQVFLLFPVKIRTRN